MEGNVARPFAQTHAEVRSIQELFGHDQPGEAVTTFVRVDVWTLTEDDPIIVSYGNAVKAMRDKSDNDSTSWAYQAAIHGSHLLPARADWNQCQHQGWYFVSWHRLYLYFFERI